MAHRFQLFGHFMSGPSYKVALMLALAGEGFDYQQVNLRAGEHKQAAHMARNRYGQLPALEDRRSGLTLVQSNAILLYLAEELGRFDGAGRKAQCEVREWLFWDFDKLSPNIYRTRVIRRGIRSYAQPVAELYFNEGNAALQQLETALSGHDWLVGSSPSIADIALYGVVHVAPDAGFDMVAYPSVSAWMARMEALQGFDRPQSLMPVPVV